MKSHPNLLLFAVLIIGVLLTIPVLTAYSQKVKTPPHSTESGQMNPQHIEDHRWNKVDSLSQQGLPKSALDVVFEIMRDALKQNNHPQFIKSFIYELKLRSDYEENFLISFLNEGEKLIVQNKVTAPSKQVVHSILADLYWQYYMMNRYVILDRTVITPTTINRPSTNQPNNNQPNNNQTDKQDAENPVSPVLRDSMPPIATWDAQLFVKVTGYHFNASLQEDELLKSISLKQYNPILEHGENSLVFRPTLFDFLAHRAVDFFMNDEASITRPVDAYIMNDPDLLKDARTFVQHHFKTGDTLSFHFQALKIFQQILQFHLFDTDDFQPLVDADLKRLEFVHNNINHPDRDSLYLHSLINLEQKYTGNQASAMVMEEIAWYYYNTPQPPVRILKGAGTGSAPQERKADYVKAREWCLKAIETFPASTSAKNCKILLAQIELKSIEFTTPEVVIPDKEFVIQVKFRNLAKLWFRLIRDERSSDREYYSDRENKLEGYLKARPVKEWTEAVPAMTDYQSHTTELILPQLPMGSYILLASGTEGFELKEQAVSYSRLQVSNISYISRNAPDGSGLVYVMSRTDGKPLKGVAAQSFTTTYDYKTRQYKRKNMHKYTSGADGSFMIRAPGANENANLSFEFIHKNDTLTVYNYYALYNREFRQKKDIIQTFFFTDRSIYRPGQPVYFKGIVINTWNKGHDLIPGHRSTVVLYDVNGQKLSEMEVTAGEYGSFSGSFVLPASGLTGMMRIDNGTGSTAFNVEEYKRPRFEVTFREIDSLFTISQQVEVTGEALSYSGVPLTDATVNYRVVRSRVFPFYRFSPYSMREMFRIWPPYKSQEAEIVNGTAQVSDSGTFTIRFSALPDPADFGENNRFYTFEVYADVTDINGEVQSGRTAVNVSDKALILGSDLPQEINLKQLKPITITSSNTNGKKVPSTVKAQLHKLKEGPLVVPRIWDLPDTLIYTRELFKSRVPQYPYMFEDSPAAGGLMFTEPSRQGTKTYEKEKLVYTTTLKTSTDSLLNLGGVTLEPGKYLLTLTSTDKFGQEVTTEQEVTIFDPDSKKIPSPRHLWFTLLTPNPAAGEKLVFLAGSAVKGNLLVEISSNGKILQHQWYNIAGQQKFEFSLPDSLTGEVQLLTNLTYDNFNFSETEVITIRDKSQELNFTFETFRSTLLPGGTEKWKIKITDWQGKPIQSELLASMYDASLDAFTTHEWFFQLGDISPRDYQWEHRQAFSITGSITPSYLTTDSYHMQQYDQLNWFGYNNFNYFNGGGIRYAKAGMMGVQAIGEEQEVDVALFSVDAEANAREEGAVRPPEAAPISDKPEISDAQPQVQVRRNLQETAFFYPSLTTNKDGEIWVEFTVPEALTRWNFMGLAHDRRLRYSQFRKEVVTQKQLMVTPNLPRFFREGDLITLRTKISNLTPNPMQGEARLEILDAMTMQPLDSEFENQSPVAGFEITPNGSSMVEWSIDVPEGVGMVLVRVKATAGNHTDGEEMMLPVLKNSMMVTETLPLPVNGKQTRKFNFPAVQNLTGTPHRLTLEFTSNPAWYAVQALPWLEARERENSDQLFNRYYANSIAAHIANSSPKIKAVFESWRNQTPEALLSQLEKNQELKALVIEETPWLSEAKNETEQKRRIAIMFDLNRIATEKSSALLKLQQNQTPNGGWPWFEGMPESRYITQLIVTGMGKLNHLQVISLEKDSRSLTMVQNAMNYLSEKIREDYNLLLKDSADLSTKAKGKADGKTGGKKRDEKYLEQDHLGYDQIQYLYALSYLNQFIQTPSSAADAIAYYSGQARKYWNNKSLYAQSMIALWAGKNGDLKTTNTIIASLREKAISNDEMGIYWRDNTGGANWYQAPVETQAIMIELFEEYGANSGGKAVGRFDGSDDPSNETDRMKTWLLKQKQTQAWPTTTATAEAVYALLLRGTDWLQTKPQVIIRTGSEMIDFTAGNVAGVQEAGTGYFKTSWSGKEITPEMGNITVAKSDEGPAWGAMYFQYFQTLDKIKEAGGPLSIRKEIFIKEFTNEGERLKKITPENSIRTGDQLTVRIVITIDRDLEFVHLKDMRAAAFEPVNVLSGYRWDGGLGYYTSTRDASTNFFIHYLPKGTHVFEYRLAATQTGQFSNGISTIQCMYAPEFAAHTQGEVVEVLGSGL